MVKKKAVVYSPNTNSDRVDIANNFRYETPPYHDSEVGFEGFFKKIVNLNTNQYELKTQIKRQYSARFATGGGTTSSITRTTGNKFICTGIFFVVDINLSAPAVTSNLEISDGVMAFGGDSKFLYYCDRSKATYECKYIDFSGNPLVFKKLNSAGTAAAPISIELNNMALVGTEVVFVQLYGFEEEI